MPDQTIRSSATRSRSELLDTMPSNMTVKEWKRLFSETVTGVEAELDSTVPKSARASLHEFHRRLKEANTKESRKSFEADFDAFLESDKYLKAAAGRYVTKKMVPAFDKAFKVMKKARTLLAKMKKQE